MVNHKSKSCYGFNRYIRGQCSECTILLKLSLDFITTLHPIHEIFITQHLEQPSMLEYDNYYNYYLPSEIWTSSFVLKYSNMSDLIG